MADLDDPSGGQKAGLGKRLTGSLRRFVSSKKSSSNKKGEMIDLDFGPPGSAGTLEESPSRSRMLAMIGWPLLFVSVGLLIFMWRDPFYKVGNYVVTDLASSDDTMEHHDDAETPEQHGEMKTEDHMVADPAVEELPMPTQYVNGIAKLIPDPDLLTWGREGQIPKITDDGRQARHAYARQFTKPKGKQLVSLVIGGLGLDGKATRAAIEKLPPEVSLSFVPYARELDVWTRRAWARGHEVLVEVPMEPDDYPANDPGPFTLTTSAPPEKNAIRLEWTMSQMNGFVGILNQIGAKFANDEEALRPLMHTIRETGLLFIEASPARRRATGAAAGSTGVAYGESEVIIDSWADKQSVADKLEQLSRKAVATGSAIGFGNSFPVTIEQINIWVRDLDRQGLVLAPVSAVVREGG